MRPLTTVNPASVKKWTVMFIPILVRNGHGDEHLHIFLVHHSPKPVAAAAVSPPWPSSEIEKVIGIAQQLQHHIRHRRIELAALVGLNLIENVLLGKLFPVNPV